MLLPFCWRVTKYDPALRDDQGHYPLGDWSSYSDIGKTFNGELLTYQQYLASETAYMDAARAFLADANLDSLTVVHFDKLPGGFAAAQREGIRLDPTSLKVGSVIGRGDLADFVRLNLREIIWGKLAVKGLFYLHFGWDFYMYVGSASPSLTAIRHAESCGLFVEPMKSLYL